MDVLVGLFVDMRKTKMVTGRCPVVRAHQAKVAYIGGGALTLPLILLMRLVILLLPTDSLL